MIRIFLYPKDTNVIKTALYNYKYSAPEDSTTTDRYINDINNQEKNVGPIFHYNKSDLNDIISTLQIYMNDINEFKKYDMSHRQDYDFKQNIKIESKKIKKAIDEINEQAFSPEDKKSYTYK